MLGSSAVSSRVGAQTRMVECGERRSYVRGQGTGGGEKETKGISFGEAFLFGRVLLDGLEESEILLTPLLPSAGLRRKGGGGEGNRSANNIPRTLRLLFSRCSAGTITPASASSSGSFSSKAQEPCPTSQVIPRPESVEMN